MWTSIYKSMHRDETITSISAYLDSRDRNEMRDLMAAIYSRNNGQNVDVRNKNCL